ncbi:MAG: amidase [Alphaproteobacteria bacterium]|nr:amidase [Alphaproteobacteria bacterium]MBV9203378.1 amidase [Alphaproteobacteria bacterium]MBV9377406.1 amidase [Alphaproteobacteria bacterium]
MVADFLTIAEAATLIEKRELSPVELTESRLSRVERLDGKLHSFIRVLGEPALAAARTAEAEIMAGRRRGPLHGIPIGLKDIYETKAVPTTGHSKVLIDHVPREDATSVRRLTEAGAIVVGKLTTHEFALGGPSFDLPWPPARNPWDTSRFTGGSSSGTGAAVAAGLVLGGTGSDTGGSIRGPAAFCGLAGLKPSYGLISRAGILPLAFSLDHAGPMTWTAEDCAIMLQAMAGHDPADPGSADRPAPDYRAALSGGIKGLRIGLIRHFYENDNPADEATRQGIAAAVKIFEELGCSVRELRLSPLADWAACGVIIMLSEAFAIHQPTLRERFGDYGEMFRDRMALATLISGGDYVQAVRRRRELATEFATAMADLDLALTAAAPGEAPAIDAVGKFATFERPMLTMPFNVTGTPAMSVCSGYSAAGLPLAFQLAGKPFDEVTVLRAAHAYEKATSWRSVRPRLDA